MAVFISPFLQAQVKVEPAKTITFPSRDGLTITADLYMVADSLPYMILCHQAGYSRGEYKETAERFCHLGFNCLALDARSGKEVNGVTNETAARALKEKKGTAYLDAEQDILSALDYAYEKSGKKVILVGSSYSASLVLKIAAMNGKVQAVMAFSPGEYFGKLLNVQEAAAGMAVPVFATSSRTEAKAVEELLKKVPANLKTQFTPTEEGRHGSSCLWESTPGNRDYWFAIVMFMKKAK